MVTPKYSAEESLQRIKLMMEYDLSKTNTENESIIQEQSMDILKYFKTAVESILNKPEQVDKINFGTSIVDAAKAAKTIEKAISGVGTTTEAIDYVINNAFKDLASSIAIIKKYPEVAGESLYEALEGEWFADETKENLIKKVGSQLMTWCQTNPKVTICIPKSEEELKYGKY